MATEVTEDILVQHRRPVHLLPDGYLIIDWWLHLRICQIYINSYLQSKYTPSICMCCQLTSVSAFFSFTFLKVCPAHCLRSHGRLFVALDRILGSIKCKLHPISILHSSGCHFFPMFVLTFLFAHSSSFIEGLLAFDNRTLGHLFDEQFHYFACSSHSLVLPSHLTPNDVLFLSSSWKLAQPCATSLL